MSAHYLPKCLQKAFGQLDINQQAIADCGWGPLNCKILEHPSLCHHKDTLSQSAHEPSGNNENAGGMAA